MSIRPVNRSQYEFEAEYVADEKTSTKFSIQMHLDGTQIYSRAQRMYFSTPSPTPNPEIDFALSDASIIYEKGKPLTIRGSIEIVSGVVAADDLALYVDGVKWEMALTERSDGSFSFEAQNELFDTSVSQLDVKVRLLSNTRISTASEKLEIVVPTATPSPSPTPRTVPTPPPAVTATPFVPGVTASAAAEATAPVVGGAIMPSDSAEPSGAPTDPDASQSPNGSDADPMVDPNAAVEAGSIMDQIKATINNMVASGTIWYVVAGIVLIIAMIVVLIIFLAGKGKGRNDAYAIKPTGSDSSHFSTDPRDWGTSVSPTSREGEEIQTVRNGSSRNADFVSGDGSSSMDPFRSDDEGASSTMRINMVNAGGGTVRLDDNDGEAGGTQRLEDDIKSVDVTLEETRGGRVCNEQNLHIECDQEVLIGRSSPAQVCIDDGAVSSRHMKISYDGVCVYITDVGSTNGTKVNGETLKANVPVEVNSGDVVRIGKTTIKLTINEY